MGNSTKASILPSHIAWYGSIRLERAYCRQCHGYAFIQEEKFACCGKIFKDKPVKQKIMISALEKRKLPSKAERKRVLREQLWCCLYCKHQFGSYYRRGGSELVRKLRINWDHLVPFSKDYNNSSSNFAAACHVCNGIKHNKIFSTIEEAREYVMGKWESKKIKITDLSTLQKPLFPRED